MAATPVRARCAWAPAGAFPLGARVTAARPMRGLVLLGGLPAQAVVVLTHDGLAITGHTVHSRLDEIMTALRRTPSAGGAGLSRTQYRARRLAQRCAKGSGVSFKLRMRPVDEGY